MRSNALLLSLSLAVSGAQAAEKTFPYAVTKRTLPNGLDVVVIETPEFKEVLSFNTLVLAGSGKEAEKGRTGLAHLFEHILFRHRLGGMEGGYDEAIRRMGAHNNAWTWFDLTYYHPLTFTSNLRELADLESARFKKLDFDEKTFKTETGAVLGEYRRGASFPSFKMEEKLYSMMFPGHPYGHTTMGFYEDVLDMPAHYEAARRFYDEYYRPGNCALIVAGDVKPEEVFAAASERYGDWQAKEPPPARPFPAPPRKEQKAHVSWDADVAPQLRVAYRTPAFRPGTPESGVMQLLGELLVSQAAPLYKRLRYDTRMVSELSLDEGSRGMESVEPRLMVLAAELFKDKYAAKGKAYFEETAGEIVRGVDALSRFAQDGESVKLLEVLRAKYRYDMLSRFKSPEEIASDFAWYYRFGRDTEVLDKLVAAVEALTPEDVERFAKTYLKAENRGVVTMASQSGSGARP